MTWWWPFSQYSELDAVDFAKTKETAVENIALRENKRYSLLLGMKETLAGLRKGYLVGSSANYTTEIRVLRDSINKLTSLPLPEFEQIVHDLHRQDKLFISKELLPIQKGYSAYLNLLVKLVERPEGAGDVVANKDALEDIKRAQRILDGLLNDERTFIKHASSRKPVHQNSFPKAA